jgi:SAM-dependent methyltransferase
MPQDQDDPPSVPTGAGFDEAFTTLAASPGLRRVWELALPDLPPEVEPFSFVSAGLLAHVARALDLAPGQTLVDLGCGRGGPGLWLARQVNATLVGLDFSPVGTGHAASRAARFGLAGRARFVIGDLARCGLRHASADAVVSVDAFHFAADPAAAASEVRRLLRPGRPVVLTSWQPKPPVDARLPGRLSIGWTPLLRGAGFTDVRVQARPEWHDLWTGVYRVALDIGDPDGDEGLTRLQDEARRHLPYAGLLERVVVTATAPG